MAETQVFLNYRADDDPFGVALLDEQLSTRFGSAAVFLASKSIRLGAEWEAIMFEAVEESSLMLAVIGRSWFGSATKGQRRIDNPNDFVRREILAAIKLGKPVIPVRLAVPRLKQSDLPPELGLLCARQDIEIRFRSRKIDIDRLADDIAAQVPALRTARSTVASAPAAETTTSGVNLATNNVSFNQVHAGGNIAGRDLLNQLPRRHS